MPEFKGFDDPRLQEYLQLKGIPFDENTMVIKRRKIKIGFNRMELKDTGESIVIGLKKEPSKSSMPRSEILLIADFENFGKFVSGQDGQATMVYVVKKKGEKNGKEESTEEAPRKKRRGRPRKTEEEDANTETVDHKPKRRKKRRKSAG